MTRLPTGPLAGGALAALLLAAAAGAASAQEAPVADSRADVLFEEGRKLAAAGKYAAACPRFAESYELDPAIGTLLNLADCYEHLGKTATAWRTFIAAADMASASSDEARETLARGRADDLDPRLARVAIELDSGAEAIAGLVVELDRAPVAPRTLGSPVPVDPGPHTVAATAPGRQPWRETVQAVGGKTVTLEVPALAPAAAAAPVTPERPRRGFGGRKVLALVAGGAGAAAVAAGSFYGLRARARWHDAKDHHCAGNQCDAEGVALVDEAHSAATLSTVLFVAGGAALAGGVVLWVTAPSPPREAPARTAAPPRAEGPRLVPAVGPGAVGVTLSGSF